MKKIIPILLLIIIYINQLHIIDAIIDFSVRYNKENTQKNKNFPVDEESETEKETKGKENLEEPEKFFARNNHILTSQFQLSDKDKFICFSTKLNIHPYQEDDIQPPKAV